MQDHAAFAVRLKKYCEKHPGASKSDIARALRQSRGRVSRFCATLGLHPPDGRNPGTSTMPPARQSAQPPEAAVRKKIAKRKFDPLDPLFRSPTVAELRKRAMSSRELEEWLGASAPDIAIMLASLREAGYELPCVDGRYRLGRILPHTAPVSVKTQRHSGATIKFGVIADLHFASVKARLDVVEMAYDEFKRQKIKTVYIVGNLIDGYRELINGGEVYLRGVTDQCVYVADHLPQRAGIVSKFITGDCHEGWYIKPTGLNVGHHLEDEVRRHGRTDIQYIGHVEADVHLANGTGESIMRLFHPGGGSSYAQSYKPQKIVESFQGGEKPHILLIGHYHKLGVFYPRNVWCLMAGCCQDQTRWMRGKPIEAHLGYSIVTVGLDKRGGVSSFKAEQCPVYDKDYHVESGEVEWESALYEALGK